MDLRGGYGPCHRDNLDSGIVLSNPYDVESLVQALTFFNKDRRRTKNMGHAARKIAEENRWKSMSKKYINLCELTQLAKEENVSINS